MKPLRFALALVVAALVVHAPGGGLLRPRGAMGDPAAATARGVFLVKCSRCHGAERAYVAIGKPASWGRAVATMALKDRAWLPPEAVREVLSYRRHLAPHQRTLFERCCGSCHAPSGLETLEKNRSQWRTCVTYMARRRCEGITSEEVELLLLRLSPGG